MIHGLRAMMEAKYARREFQMTVKYTQIVKQTRPGRQIRLSSAQRPLTIPPLVYGVAKYAGYHGHFAEKQREARGKRKGGLHAF
jgi:hypothetical protein